MREVIRAFVVAAATYVAVFGDSAYAQDDEDHHRNEQVSQSSSCPR
jgi:hypothetical protein